MEKKVRRHNVNPERSFSSPFLDENKKEMSDKPLIDGQFVGNKSILPTKAIKTAFAQTVAKSLGDFLQNAYRFVLAKLIEQQRKNIGVRDLYDHFDQTLNSKTTDPTIRAQQRADLMSLISNYVNRTNRSIDTDFAAKALAELFSSLDSVSVVADQEETRKKKILESLSGVSLHTWRDAIFSIAIRSTTFANATDPLDLKVALVVDESTAKESHGKVAQISLYTLATDTIKKWISNAKLTYATIKGKPTTLQQASSSNGSSPNVLFVEIVLHIFSSPSDLCASLETAVINVLEKYANHYVIASPNATAELRIAQKDWIIKTKSTHEKVAKGSRSASLTEEAKLALEYGMSARAMIDLAYNKGYCYGAGRQLNMFRAYEGVMKDRAMEYACRRVLAQVGQENSLMQSSLLNEVGRIVSQNQDNGTAQQYQLFQLYEQQQQLLQQQQQQRQGILPSQSTAIPQQQNTGVPNTSSQYPQSHSQYPYQQQTQQQQAQPQAHLSTNSGLPPFMPPPPSHPTTQPPPTYPPNQSVHQLQSNYHPPNYGQYNQHHANGTGSFPYHGTNNSNHYPPATNNRQVSFADSAAPSSSNHGKSYTSPPPPFQYKPAEKTSGQPFKPSPMTQNTSRRAPKPVYEDSSGEDSDTDNSSQEETDSSGSDFEESSDSDY